MGALWIQIVHSSCRITTREPVAVVRAQPAHPEVQEEVSVAQEWMDGRASVAIPEVVVRAVQAASSLDTCGYPKQAAREVRDNQVVVAVVVVAADVMKEQIAMGRVAAAVVPVVWAPVEGPVV